MALRDLVQRWPAYRQLTGGDRLGRGSAARSATTARLTARTATVDRVVKSVCPYCAVGCGQNVYVKDERVVQIEGDPDSPVSRGRLCPKGSATLQLTTGPAREHQVLYRRPYGRDWEPLDLDTALDMVADRVLATRRATWQWEQDGMRVARTLGIASLGGATLDNEENYLIKKLFTGLGVVQVENQARVCHSSTVAGLGTSFGRGGATTFMQDLQNSDCIVIQGSNYAEAHPVGFQWVMEAKARGATVIHVDPRYTRTSALADLHVPIRAGTDVAFLGGIINHVLTEGKDFRSYVRAYTNAATIVAEDFQDTEDLDGVFSGLDAEHRHYDATTWQYQGAEVQAASGERDQLYDELAEGERLSGIKSAGGAEAHGSGGARADARAQRDETLRHPRCVYQILKRHYARYTPEMVQDICGVPPETFRTVCDALTANSGPDRTSAFVYAVGWTQHSTGAQYIRAAAILQLLLGNIGRPGGGIQALRGHASIQGSSDIPTLFNLLPGYLPMPHAHAHQDLDSFIAASRTEKGFWGEMRAYFVSLLKAYFGDAATADNDYCFDHLPRLTGSHSTYDTVIAQLEGVCKGYFLMGENPAVGSANTRLQRLGMANLDWLVVRDFSLIESATWWKDGPEIATGELATDEIATEVFFFPAASHTEKSGSFTNTNRWVQWHHAAVEPDGDARSDLWFVYHLGRRIKARLAGSTDPMDRPLLDLTWDYPVHGPLREPSAEAVLAEINGTGPDGAPLSAYTQLKDDGTTSCGCWIYCGVGADGVNQAARRKPHTQQDWVAAEWAWAWPANRRILYNRASAAPDGTPWSERKAYVWWDPDAGRWTGHDIPDFIPDRPPGHVPGEDAEGPDALRGDDPFIMQADGKGWLYAPAGLVDGPLPSHYEPQDSPFGNPLHPGQQRSPVRQVYPRPGNDYHPSGAEPGAEVYPYVVTTHRLTEHFTAGGMSRWSPYLSELQPEFFCEVSPQLAAERGLEHHGWATVITARNAIEARVMVTERIKPLTVQGRTVHQIGLPFHWGPNGCSPGDAANELTAIALDPNAHIQEVKALSADIRPGRRPRGAALPRLVAAYRARAGITPHTGTEVRP
ncbi:MULTISPECIES: formate dehydrogenase [Streptomycetaceae]|uniref:Formate dehydrogenase, alpha subunit n=1 Tax=Streptantibioticus cattleyicolor (strain ATCC 35852 / DSM 46488 / JCM 4925 / NBRC 14057 / NRRL 8057) TaxID=1003195 RepID=F8JQI0_STREN|nr:MULTISPECIES: formate dehydrogenase [Streptomycetaceae]AEW97822.1 formate dehydrogenase, alpha subunit [Streptantibioticus cattleyicolor NRRL 8057 = DSM 46488]MYS62238.1 molybdopterin-dependent oxidoreductase [Streptomyces sp. SID5468]CCB78141.1 Formate dehydrogenase, alpha subunit [Streptantibioticus cattleyicolor NRRL 8057 = DSM 46488]